MKQSKTVPATGRKTGKQDRGGGFRLEDWNWSWSPRSQKEAGDAIVTNFMLHWFPNRVSLESISIRYSYWLGTITAFLFFYLVFTGVILMFHYIPSVERAYASIKDIEYAVSFGSFLRASHRIAAHLMVAMVFLHMVRVFLTGAYRNGGLARQFRPLNWWIGLVLLVLTLFLSFTGYLLPWDQLAYWAITVGTNIAQAVPVVGNDIRFFLLGGNEINQNTLIRFYVLHCVFLPLIVTGLFLLFFVPYHLYTFKYGTHYKWAVNPEVRDIYRLMVEKFSSVEFTALYSIFMLLLSLHLWHGVGSAFESLGARYRPGVRKFGQLVAAGLLVGFCAVPWFIFFKLKG